jgi:hypothetical protein
LLGCDFHLVLLPKGREESVNVYYHADHYKTEKKGGDFSAISLLPRN